jgi:hypothetical protein
VFERRADRREALPLLHVTAELMRAPLAQLSICC